MHTTLTTTLLLGLFAGPTILAQEQKTEGDPAIEALLNTSVSGNPLGTLALIANLKKAIPSSEGAVQLRLQARLAELYLETGNTGLAQQLLAQMQKQDLDPKLLDWTRKQQAKLKEALDKAKAEKESAETPRLDDDPLSTLLHMIDETPRDSKCRDAMQELRELGPLAVPSLLAHLEKLGPHGRQNAIQILSEFPRQEVIERFERYLRSEDLSLKLPTAAALPKLPEEPALHLAALAGESRDPSIRLSVIEVKLRHGSDLKEPLTALRELMANADDKTLYDALARLWELPESVKAKLAEREDAWSLVQDYLDHSYTPVQHWAARNAISIFARTRTADVEARLLRLLNDDDASQDWLGAALSAHDGDRQLFPDILLAAAKRQARTNTRYGPKPDIGDVVKRFKDTLPIRVLAELLQLGEWNDELNRHLLARKDAERLKLLREHLSLCDDKLKLSLLEQAASEGEEELRQLTTQVLGLEPLDNAILSRSLELLREHELPVPKTAAIRYLDRQRGQNTLLEALIDSVRAQVKPDDAEELLGLVRIPRINQQDWLWNKKVELARAVVGQLDFAEAVATWEAWRGRIDRRVEGALLDQINSAAESNDVSVLQRLFLLSGHSSFLESVLRFSKKDAPSRAWAVEQVSTLLRSSDYRDRDVATRLGIKTDLLPVETRKQLLQVLVDSEFLSGHLMSLAELPPLLATPERCARVLDALESSEHLYPQTVDWVLGQLDLERKLARLAEMLKPSMTAQPNTPFVLARLLSDLAEKKDAKLLMHFTPALEHPELLVRIAAIQAVGMTWSRDAVPWLLDALKTDDRGHEAAQKQLDRLYSYFKEEERWSGRKKD